MRHLIVLLVVALAGCASGSLKHAQHCSVFQYGGNVGKPFGLVTLPPRLEQHLRAQLPPKRANAPICWYATGEEILASQGASEHVKSGVTFRRNGDKWLLSDDPEIILELPSVID